MLEMWQSIGSYRFQRLSSLDLLIWRARYLHCHPCSPPLIHFQDDESTAILALSGFGLESVLGELDLPTGGSDRLGLSGISALTAGQISSDKFGDTDETIGLGQGRDWEDEVDREIGREDYTPRSSAMKPLTLLSSRGVVPQKRKRTKVIRKVVERPRSVYERFPAFEKDRTLDFSELFKGFIVQKPSVSKRPFNCELCRGAILCA